MGNFDCKKMVKNAFNNNAWIAEVYKRCIIIKDFRGKHCSIADYGFEWALETLFYHYLIANSENLLIEKKTIRANQTIPDSKSKRRYDLSFTIESCQHPIIIELKTTTKKNLNWTLDDLKKYFPDKCEVYLITFSYPHEEDWNSKKVTDRYRNVKEVGQFEIELGEERMSCLILKREPS